MLSPRHALALLLLLATTPTLALWSGNPASNLVIADNSGEQVQTRMVATGDGGFYLSWFDSSSGYGVRLQRLDAAGNEQWAHNGVLVATRDFSSTQDYGLSIDSAGNALLAFRYRDSGGVAQILAQKVAPNGTAQWGSPGVFVSADASDANAPKITGTSDGNAAVAWSDSTGAIRVQKLSAAGAPLWSGSGVSIAPPMGFFFLADLRGDNAGNVIAAWSAQLSAQSRQYWAQKLASANGASLWNAGHVKVFDGSGGALQFGYFPPFLSDGVGGAVFVWYIVGVSAGSVRVQHIDASGVAAFAQNGIEASTNAAQSHVSPSGAYDPVSGDIYALWRETDIATQSQIGVYAQRIDASGARQWGAGGKVLVPLAGTDQTQMTALPAAGGVYAAWASGSAPNPQTIRAARIGSDGNFVWTGSIVDLSTEPNSVARLTGAISSSGYAAYAWTASASGGGDIHAQNINPDGSLGSAGALFQSGFEGN
ncbi:MAG: hypothetical protein AB7E72_14090 [Lysobacterales bacterium]